MGDLALKSTQVPVGLHCGPCLVKHKPVVLPLRQGNYKPLGLFGAISIRFVGPQGYFWRHGD